MIHSHNGANNVLKSTLEWRSRAVDLDVVEYQTSYTSTWSRPKNFFTEPTKFSAGRAPLCFFCDGHTAT